MELSEARQLAVCHMGRLSKAIVALGLSVVRVLAVSYSGCMPPRGGM